MEFDADELEIAASNVRGAWMEDLYRQHERWLERQALAETYQRSHVKRHKDEIDKLADKVRTIWADDFARMASNQRPRFHRADAERLFARQVAVPAKPASPSVVLPRQRKTLRLKAA